MRLFEILKENDILELNNTLSTILMSAKASGMEGIDINALTKKMNDLGYPTSVDALRQTLQGNPIVSGVDGDTVLLGAQVSGSEAEARDTDEVEQMAMDAADKSLQQGN